MSRPMADTPKRRARRQFTDEFKAGAVRLVLDDGKTVGAAARDLDLTETAARVGQAGTRRSVARSHRAHDGRARGVGAVAERESGVADGARRPNKSRGLLREAPSVKFAWIAAERAELTVADCCRLARLRPVDSMHGSSGPRSHGPRGMVSCAYRFARRTPQVTGTTAARVSGRTCTKPASGSARSASVG